LWLDRYHTDFGRRSLLSVAIAIAGRQSCGEQSGDENCPTYAPHISPVIRWVLMVTLMTVTTSSLTFMFIISHMQTRQGKVPSRKRMSPVRQGEYGSHFLMKMRDFVSRSKAANVPRIEGA
jgi:hypothetical protein